MFQVLGVSRYPPEKGKVFAPSLCTIKKETLVGKHLYSFT